MVAQRGRLEGAAIRRDVTDHLTRASGLAGARLGTMHGTTIQDSSGTYLFLCGRSRCDGPDLCGD